MRVTSEMMVDNSLKRLSTRMSQYERAQARLATGKEIRQPSDDPAKANRGLALRATREGRVQEQRNAQDAKSWLNTADSTLQSAMSRIQRVRELAVQGANPHDATSKGAIADEVATIRDELVGLANTELRGQHLFSGYSNDAPVEVAADGTVTVAGDPADPDEITRRVGDSDRVRVNTTAAEAFGTGAGGLFATLGDLEDRLRTGQPVSDSLPGIDAGRDRLSGELSRIGANTNWVESAIERSKDSLHTIESELAQVEDADYAKAVMDLQIQDTALQSTLQALGRALPPSLASFLR